jgi:hypothetical protein
MPRRFSLSHLAPSLAMLLFLPFGAFAAPSDGSEACIACHSGYSAALVQQWQGSRHASAGVGCVSCHQVAAGDPRAGDHMGFTVAMILTPKDCSRCHAKEYAEFESSHHAKAGDILASLDNVLAERAAGMPGNIADAVSGCWQCHGSIVAFQKDAKGAIVKDENTGFPKPLAATWPNSGIGRINTDGSYGTCNACHSRHDFGAKVARAPDNCGKCHLGPDHPQAEIYAESKHGIAFQANKDKMALDKEGDWVLGKDYSAAPTCTTCHIGAYTTSSGTVVASNHDVGERISWTLRPVVSTKINRVVFADGYQDDYPETKALPAVGSSVEVTHNRLQDGVFGPIKATLKVAKIITWQERRDEMKGVCMNCHGQSQVEGFYSQYDDLVNLFDDKFAKVGLGLMNDLLADKILSANAPYEKPVQWTWYELWHHQGRRARMGASMSGPDYTHWHGMYEVAKSFYVDFLPEVIDAAADKGSDMKAKYAKKVADIMARDENIWTRGLTPQEAARLNESLKAKYGK